MCVCVYGLYIFILKINQINRKIIIFFDRRMANVVNNPPSISLVINIANLIESSFLDNNTEIGDHKRAGV